MTKPLPLVGAAMPSTHLEQHINWLIDEQRPLEIQDFAAPEVLDGDWKPHVANIKSKLDGYNGPMGIHAPFWNLPLAAMDPKIRAVVVERHLQALDAAAELGATHMVIHSPLAFLGMPASLTNPKMGRDLSLFDIIHDTMKDIVKRAEEISCVLVIENIFDQLPLMLTDLVKSFDSDCVRQSLDTGHAFIMHQRGAPPPDYFASEAGELLAHIHLQDTDGYTDRHWTIGQGQIDWHALLNVVHTMASEPRLILELRKHEDIPVAAQWLMERGLVR